MENTRVVLLTELQCEVLSGLLLAVIDQHGPKDKMSQFLGAMLPAFAVSAPPKKIAAA